MSNSVVWSVKNGDLEEVKKSVVQNNVNQDFDGRKPIHYAADFGQNEVIEYLLSVGADINAVDAHGLTALLSAVYEGHTSTVKLLLSRGAKRDHMSPDGRSYIDCAEKAEIKQLLKT